MRTAELVVPASGYENCELPDRCQGADKDARDDFARFADVANERKIPNASGVELPVGHLPSVGTPAESVADGKLFFIYPIGGPLMMMSDPSCVSCVISPLARSSV